MDIEISKSERVQVGVLEGAVFRGAASDCFIGSPITVLSHIKQSGILSGAAIVVFSDVVVLAAPEADDVVNMLLQAAEFA